jgi:formiminotetrahydrofolate cyclodeaminase
MEGMGNFVLFQKSDGPQNALEQAISVPYDIMQLIWCI